jgi:hypothetical protein
MLDLIETDLSWLPDLSNDYPLTSEQIEAFRRDGFALLPGVCSLAEIAAYRPVIQAVARRLNREVRRLEERDTYGQAFLQTMQLRLHSRAVERLVLARRFGKIVAELLGAEGVRVYHKTRRSTTAGRCTARGQTTPTGCGRR